MLSSRTVLCPIGQLTRTGQDIFSHVSVHVTNTRQIIIRPKYVRDTRAGRTHTGNHHIRRHARAAVMSTVLVSHWVCTCLGRRLPVTPRPLGWCTRRCIRSGSVAQPRNPAELTLCQELLRRLLHSLTLMCDSRLDSNSYSTLGRNIEYALCAEERWGGGMTVVLERQNATK